MVLDIVYLQENHFQALDNMLGQAGSVAALQEAYPHLNIANIARGVDQAPFSFVQDVGSLSNVYHNKNRILQSGPGQGMTVPASKKQIEDRMNHFMNTMRTYSDPELLMNYARLNSQRQAIPDLHGGGGDFRAGTALPGMTMTDRVAVRNNLNAFMLTHNPADAAKFYRGKGVNEILNRPITDSNSIARIAEKGAKNKTEQKALDVWGEYIKNNNPNKFSLPTITNPFKAQGQGFALRGGCQEVYLHLEEVQKKYLVKYLNL